MIGFLFGVAVGVAVVYLATHPFERSALFGRVKDAAFWTKSKF